MNSLIRIVIAFAFFLMTSPVIADTEAEITAALDYFAEIWNEGDLDAIEGYYHPDFVLVTDAGSIAQGQLHKQVKTGVCSIIHTFG